MAKHTEERRIIDMEKNGLLEIIAAHRTGDALNEIMAQDKDYQEALARQQVAFDRLDELELTREQRSTINQAITANNHFGAVYGAVAYRFGMGGRDQGADGDGRDYAPSAVMMCCAAIVDSLSAAQDIGADNGKGWYAQ